MFLLLTKNFAMNNCIHHFKNNLTSSAYANFRLDIFHSKIALHSFWGKENGLEADTICKVFSHLNICFHYHIFIILHIEYEHSYLTLSSCISVKYTQVLESFV